MRLLRFSLGVVAALIETAIAIALVFTSNHEDQPWLVAPFAIVAGWSFIAAGLVALWRRPENGTGFLLAATGYLWFVAALTESNNAWGWTAGFVFSNFAFVAFVALVLAYPDGRLSRRDVWVIAIAGSAAVGTNLLGALLTDDPAACSKCPHSAITITNVPGLKNPVLLVATAIIVPSLAYVAVVLLRRWRRASGARRRLLQPVFVSGGIAVTLLLVSVGAERVSETAYSVVWLIFLVSFAAVPLAFLAGVLRSRLDRASAASMLLALDAGSPLRDALADALHDPSLEIVYRLAERDSWVTVEGRVVPPPASSPTRSVTMVERNDHQIAALVHDPALDDEREVVDSIASAAWLSLQNEQLNADLRAQYRFLETVAMTAPSPLVVVGIDGVIRNQNHAATKASGHDDEERIRGRFFWDVFIDECEHDGMRERFAAVPDFEAADFENTFTNARGERRVIAWQSAPVRDESGLVTSVIAGGVDITERKAREEELQATGERLQAVIGSAPVAIVEVGLDFCVKRWNPAAEKIFGWSEAEALERSAEEMMLIPDDRLAERDQIREHLGSNVRHAGFETVRLRRDGTSVDVEITASPICDPTGQAIGYMVVVVDISERKRREVESQRERDFLNTLADTTPSLIALVDHDGLVVPPGVNEAFRKTIGLSDAELMGRSLVDVIDATDRESALHAIATAAIGEASAEVESGWTRTDGGIVTVMWSATPITDSAGSKLVLITGRDVTERKRQEMEIRASRARIVSAGDDARRRLERNLHDGAQQRLVSLSLALRLAQSKTLTDAEAAAEILSGASAELALALDELRELARGIHPAILTDRGLAAALESLAARTPLPIELTIVDERLPEQVQAAVYYVVSESLANVVKYARATAVHVTVSADGDDYAVHVEVADDGIGGADPSGGSGLRGLADRVAAFDGSLLVDSPAGGGTRVIAEIPLPRTVLPA